MHSEMQSAKLLSNALLLIGHSHIINREAQFVSSVQQIKYFLILKDGPCLNKSS